MRKYYWRTGLTLLAAFVLAGAGRPAAYAVGGEHRSGLGTISGTVRDGEGNPLAGVLIKVLRDGANEVVRETRSGSDGSFSTRVSPGRYLLRALAEGFAPATFTAVQITPSAELVYRFNLEPAGEGRTTPERRPDRNDPKFKIRAAHRQRSIFQAGEGEDANISAALDALARAEESAEATATGDLISQAVGAEPAEPQPSAGRTKGVVETFIAASADKSTRRYAGLNFALAAPVSPSLDVVFAGQWGASDRLETTARLRPHGRHTVNVTLGGARIPAGGFKTLDRALGQVSVRAVDEWVVRDGVVLVVGLDYSRFLGAGGADSLSPRLGVEFEANPRTRLRAGFAPGADAATRVEPVALLEGGPVLFREQAGQGAVAVVDGRAVMERSRRLEFGVERVIDGKSSVEATAFFDTTEGRGVGLLSVPLNSFSAGGAALLDVANQQGAARGLRIVYTRRISQHLKASAGYSFGRGQQLSPEGLTDPEGLFQDGFFQTAAAQFDASVLEGTNVRTVLRFSPRAAVFAIDPFAGRLAVYDPSLSIQVTQELPTFGLPVRAQATLDARNLLDVLTGVEDADSSLSLSGTRRTVRGGISVRF